jgi:hypothetical protein
VPAKLKVTNRRVTNAQLFTERNTTNANLFTTPLSQVPETLYQRLTPELPAFLARILNL